uniref:RING-type domain-containing protein n=1 Tax=Panagrellus redivivus TaxID=6233 RepID=A0A7E4W6K3_PANRE
MFRSTAIECLTYLLKLFSKILCPLKAYKAYYPQNFFNLMQPSKPIHRLTQCRSCKCNLNLARISVCTFACRHVFHTRCLPSMQSYFNRKRPENCPKCALSVKLLKKKYKVRKAYRFRELPWNVPENLSYCVCCSERIPTKFLTPCQLSCGHLFHFKCVEKFVLGKEKCPICLVPAQLTTRKPRIRGHRKLKIMKPKLSTISEEEE